MFRHADVVCLCLVCILWQFSFGCVVMSSALLCILGPDCSYILQGLA